MTDRKIYLIAHKKVSYYSLGLHYKSFTDPLADYYKIGIATNPKRRMSQLSSGTPHELELVTTIESDRPQDAESYLHSMFHQHRVKNEWFRFTTGIVNSLKGLDRVEISTLEELNRHWHTDRTRFDRSFYVDYKRAEKANRGAA